MPGLSRLQIARISHWFLIGLVPLLAIGCAGGGDNQIPPRQLYASIQDGTPPPIVDVRTGWEYGWGHVPGAIHIPIQSLWERHWELDASRAEPVVVYCEHGPRACCALSTLRRAGYREIFLMKGHMRAWRKAGLPTAKPSS